MSDVDAQNEERTGEETEQGDEERREQGERVPFDAMVEVGSAAGPSFEAQAVDVSEDGIHLKTTFLPELGQALTCRFETGPDSSVLASGEVVWRHDEGTSGEFGVRFTDLDEESAAALSKIAVITDQAEIPADPTGTKVRLHIEGLGSPMRARVKGSNKSELTVGSELGFLQVGKELELEDATSGKKRPARIDRVDVEINPETKIPQLVVSLKYEDVEDGSCDVEVDERSGAGDLESIESAGEKMKSAFARKAAQVTPALMDAVKKMKVAAIAYADKKMKKNDDAAPKRMTAPPPAGALHAAGRKVVRDDAAEAPATIEKGIPFFVAQAELHKKKIMIGTACTAMVLLFVLATHKSTPAPAVAKAAPESGQQAPDQAAQAGNPAVSGGPVANEATMANATQPIAQTTNAMGGGAPIVMPPGQITASQYDAPAADQEETTDEPHHPTHVVPFTSGGPVGHGNVLRLKMDGPIEKIEGASQATGFTVVIPNRRSLEAAAPLAARDGRIASIKIENEGSGAELTMQFKDGVPSYEVRAKGDELEIVLAPLGAVAKREAKDHPGRASAERAVPSKKTPAHHPKKH